MIKKVLDIRIDDGTENDVLTKVISWLEPRTQNLVPKLIFTPGPEFIVTAQKDPEFKKILNSSDLNVPDGFGLHLAGIKNRVPGVDLMIELCRVAAQNNWSVGLLGGFGGVAEIAGQKLKDKFPKLKVKFALSDKKADEIVSYYLIDKFIAMSIDRIDKVDILFVGLGHPKQEKFLYSLANSKFRVGMGVGGSFDLIAGIKKRAPRFISKTGFEWLWRAFQDPRHFSRVWRATVEFFWLLVTTKL